MPTPTIPVETFSVVNKHMLPSPHRRMSAQVHKAKPFEADLKILPKGSLFGPRHIQFYDDESGITYLMHSIEVRKMLTGGNGRPPAKIEGGVVSGIFGFGRVSSSLTLKYLGPKPVRVGLINHLTNVAKQAVTEVERVIKEHGGDFLRLHWGGRAVDGTQSATYGAWKITLTPTIEETSPEWVTEVEFANTRPHSHPPRKFSVRKGETQELLRAYFGHVRAVG